MLVLGLDPGLAITGYGLVRGDGGNLEYLDCGAIRTSPESSPVERLAILHRELTRVVQEHRPDAAAVEQLFFSTNARTAMKVGQARGVILLSLALEHIPVAEYTPMQVKQAVTGYGGAGKAQVQEMVRLLLSLNKPPRPDDVADALAVSICHHHSAHFSGLVQEATRRNDR